MTTFLLQNEKLSTYNECRHPQHIQTQCCKDALNKSMQRTFYLIHFSSNDSEFQSLNLVLSVCVSFFKISIFFNR